MSREIRVLHCGDLHLDSLFGSVSPTDTLKRRSELRDAFVSMINYAVRNRIDIVLIAGDVYEKDFVTQESVSLMCQCFADNPQIKFVISPGNHDPYTQNSVYAMTDFPKNVHVFRESKLTSIYYPDLNTEVFGYAFTSPSLPIAPFANFKVEDKSRINLLCAHCDLIGNADYCPTTASELLSCGFDYAALGHIHNSEGIRKSENRYYGYCGCLEGRNFGECGHKGAICCVFSKENGVFSAEFHGVRFSKRRYEKITVDLSGEDSSRACYEKIREAVKDYKSDTVLQINLVGDVNCEGVLSGKYISDTLCSELFSCEVVDKTNMYIDYSALEKDYSLRGAYYRRLKKSINSENEQIRQYALAALKLGLRAINEGKLVDDFASGSMLDDK